MKKLLVVALAAIGMVACVQNEVVETPKSSAIAFESAFINNATRAAADPSITTATIDGFNVWGFMDQPEAYVFVAEDVTKTADGWDYANTQYWAPAHTYYFAALAPMDSANWTLSTDNANTLGAGIVSFLNVDGSEDLIYAATSVETPKTLEELTNNGMEKVGLTFNHLLSKVKFTFKNGFLTDNVSIVVRDVEMKAKQGGSLDLATADWWVEDKWTDNGATTLLDFGDVEKLTNGKSAEAAQERLTIPADAAYVYAITFNVDYYVGGVLANTFAKESNVSGVALRMGNAYNFVAEITPDNLNLPAIEFDVITVKEWVEAGDVSLLETELLNAAKNGGDFTLAHDLTLTEALNVVADLNIDLAGNTLTGSINLANGATLTVENGAIVNTDDTTSGIVSNGDLTLDNVTIESARHALRIESGNVVINGGVYKAVPTSKKTLHALNVGDDNTVANVTINGGQFIGPKGTIADSGAAVAVKAGSTVTINGGDYKGGKNNTLSSKGTLTIYGGTFDQEPNAEWLAADHTAYKNGDGKYEVVEGTKASSQDDLNNAIADGATIALAAGEYNMPSTGGKDVTIVGGKDVVINAGASNMGNGNVTLEGVTITAGSYKGFQHSGVVTYNNVTIKGQLNCYGEKDIFNNCTFELNNEYVWTYGSNETEFNNCTFNTTGKAILIYNEGAGACNVKVEGCTFNATAGAKAGAIANQNCAAIEIDNYAKMAHKLTTSGNTYSSNFSGEWRIKSYVDGAPVTVNGVEYTQIAIDGKLMTIDANKNVTVQ